MFTYRIVIDIEIIFLRYKMDTNEATESLRHDENLVDLLSEQKKID